jgi:predicted dehydrogenase
MATFRVAFLGCGGIMHKHALQSRELPEVEIVGLCDISPANMAKLVEKSLTHLPTPPPTFATPADMYRATRPDAVVIATPHTLHYGQACEALDAGCHVLVEKPMVTDLGQAIDLERRVSRAGKVLCIGYNTPCTAELYTLRDMIRTEELGKLKVVSLYLSQNWYRNTKGLWRQDPALSGGGQMYDSGAHLMNSLVWTVESDVAEVYAHIDRLDTAVDINGTATIRFANGVLASVAIAGVIGRAHV